MYHEIYQILPKLTNKQNKYFKLSFSSPNMTECHAFSKEVELLYKETHSELLILHSAFQPDSVHGLEMCDTDRYLPNCTTLKLKFGLQRK